MPIASKLVMKLKIVAGAFVLKFHIDDITSRYLVSVLRLRQNIAPAFLRFNPLFWVDIWSRFSFTYNIRTEL